MLSFVEHVKRFYNLGAISLRIGAIGWSKNCGCSKFCCMGTKLSDANIMNVLQRNLLYRSNVPKGGFKPLN